jgi:hypothetical protein
MPNLTRNTKGNEMEKEGLEIATQYGYSFPQQYLNEVYNRAQIGDCDWYNNLKEDGTHEYFESYDDCQRAYLEGYYNELKL